MTMLEAVDGEHRTYLDLAEVIEEQSDRATSDLRELWRRIAFSRLVGNTDDHLRNHGFLRTTTGGWSLSPAFDLNPNPEVGAKRFRTATDGSGDDDPGALLGLAGFFRLTPAEASSILAEVTEATARWRDVARKAGLKARAITQMEPAFDHPRNS